MKRFLLVMAVLVGTLSCYAQSNGAKAEAAYQKAYEKRIKKERLYGVYIPKDIADSFGALNSLTAQSSRQAFKNAPEEVAVKKLHFSLGRWIIHNWGFYGGSRLSQHIKELGVTHPDDQAKLIILSYHRYLNKKPLQVKEQVDVVLERQKKKLEARLKKATILETIVRKRVPVKQ